MRDISESDRRTLEQAIAMANDLAARSMAELDSDSLDSPHTPSSPTKKKFSFKLKPSPPMARRNFSTEAASIPDIQVGCLSNCVAWRPGRITYITSTAPNGL